MRLAFALAAVLVFPPPALAQAPRGITFALTAEEATTVINALGEHPWKDVNTLMQKMIGQANAQLAPPIASSPIPTPLPPAAPPAASPEN
jgi:hypothetical protein